MKLDWLTEDAKTFLKDKYLREGETIEQRYQTIFNTCENICKEEGIADRLKDYIERNWLSFATPVQVLKSPLGESQKELCLLLKCMRESFLA